MADKSAPDKKEPLKKGATVRVQCDGFSYQTKLTEDDKGGPTVKVGGLGEVKRERLILD